MKSGKQLFEELSEEVALENQMVDMRKEMAEIFIENLMFLKDNYSHIDGELSYDLENLIAEYEEFC